MPRLIVKTAHKPYVLEPQKEPQLICMCGLSKNQPFCDKSHKKTLDEKEDILYVYDPVTGERSAEHADEECCGGEGGCCCQHEEPEKKKAKK